MPVSSLSRLLSLLTLCAVLVTAVHMPSAHAVNPCAAASGDPAPPIGEPEIAGQINLDSSAVENATVTLYRCDGSTAVSVATDSTDASGSYLFTGLTGSKWYYVEVSLAGPLAGKSPAAGTSNPSDLIEVGAGATGVDFDFE